MATHWRKTLFWKHYRRRPTNDSVVLITGASSGIGRQVALLYAHRDKPKLVLAARSEKVLDEVVEQCRAAGAQAIGVKTDVTKLDDCKRLMEKAVKEFGGIDILVLNAGIGAHGEFTADQDLEVYNKLMQVNFFGYLNCTKYAYPELLKSRHGGMIVVVSSLSGEMGLPYRSAYCASKFAVTGFFEAFRSELGLRARQQGKQDPAVDIVIVCPPTVQTSLRENAIQSLRSEPNYNAGEAISAEKCAEVIVEAADRRLRKVFFPLPMFLGVYVRPIFPDLVDFFSHRRAARL